MNSSPTADLQTTPPSTATNIDSWVELYGDYLFRFAVGQVRNPTEAEDLVQETYLAALKARDRFSGQSSERTWLIGILRHKIYDYLRAKCRAQKHTCFGPTTEPDEETPDKSLIWVHEAAAECAGPDRRMELKEFRKALEMALGQLPPRIAQAFELYELEEHSGADVCKAMRISESNLWVMLHRARGLLRKQLSPFKSTLRK